MTAKFKATFNVNTSVDAQTVMYLNKQYWYKLGYKVTLKVGSDKLADEQV